MKLLRTPRRLLTLPFALALALCAQGAAAQEALAGGKLRLAGARGVPDRYIVVLADEAADHRGRPVLSATRLAERESVIADLAVTHRAVVERLWFWALPGFSARLSRADAAELAADPRVAFVEQVAAIELSPFYPDCNAAVHGDALAAVFSGAEQVIDCANPVPGGTDCRDNWGLARIDSATLDTRFLPPAAGATVHAYLIDTGITPGHREFKTSLGASRVGSGVNASVSPLDPARGDVADSFGNSHGTHVSAILGGLTYGVNKSVILHPVRYTGSTQAFTDVLVDSLEWILENRPAGQPAVASLSSNSSDLPGSSAVALAARRTIQAGITLVESAGNRNGAVSLYAMTGGLYPPEILLVGGSSRADRRWLRNPADTLCSVQLDCGSNFGPEIDLFAPSEDILSASNKPEDRACFLSGTSMAAPHVAGAAAALLARFPAASPGAVEEALIRIATLNRLDPATLSGSPNRLLFTRFPASGAPVAGNDLFQTPANTALVLPVSELTAGDFDWAGGALTFLSAGSAVNGTVSVAGSTVTFTPNPGFSGEGRFTYTIRNAASQQDTGLVRIQVGSLPLPPVAVDDALATGAGVAVQFTTASLLANDFDPDSGFSFDDFVEFPAHGTLEAVSAGTWRYVPNAGLLGLDRFRYRIRDTSGSSDLATVDVRVGGPTAGALYLDRFTNVSPLRDPGDPLNGTRTEVGNALWTATAASGLGSGILTNLSTSGAVIGGVPFQPGSFPTAKATRLEARVNAPTSAWTGIGFASTATGGYWTVGQVWVFLRSNGELTVHANGTTHLLYRSPVPAPGFVAGWNSLALEVDWSDRTVRAWLNGAPQPLTVSDLDVFGFVPNVQFAGYHAHPGASPYPATLLAGIDDFQLTQFQTSSRPEVPTNVAASDDLFSDKVRVTWTAVPGATGYKVYRATNANPTGALPVPAQATTATLDDRTAVPGTQYFYWVRAVNASGQSALSASNPGRRLSSGQVLRTFAPVADATAKQTSPNGNFGAETLLGLRYTSTGQGLFSFIRFDVTGVDGAVETAVLEVRPDPAQVPGISVFAVDDHYWDESTLTWNNWDDCSTPLFLRKSWEVLRPSGGDPRVAIDVTEAVRGNGSVTIGLATDFDVAGNQLVSRNNAAVPWRPALRVYYRPGTPRTFRLEPTADARVSEPQPTTNFGTQDFLRLRPSGAGLAEHSYLKFVVPGTASTVQSATLRLRTQETAISAPITTYRVATSSWTETGITFANAPLDVTAQVGTATNPPANTWIDQVLFTGAGGISASGTHALGIVTGSNFPNQDFWSRESTCRPRLEVTISP